MNQTDLVELLLECPSMKDAETRQAIMNQLPPHIHDVIETSRNPKGQVLNIVNACMNFEDGMSKLIEQIRFFYGKMISFQTLVRRINQEKSENTERQWQPIGGSLMQDRPIIIISLLALLILFIGIAKAATLNPEEPEVAQLVEQAKQAIDNGEFEQADKRLSAAKSLAANGKLKMTQLAYREAGEYYERAANLLPAGNDEALVLYLNRAGVAFSHAGLYDQAKPLYERALAIREKVFGKEHPDVAESLNNLAALHEAQGNYDQAKPLYERALAIREKVFSKEHPDVALSLNNLASLHNSQGNYDQAKSLYERSLAIREKVFGKEHPSVATSVRHINPLF
ncbi:tetratricopeptide repeat protein [Candidatus Marithioploca araucensis]|uniref:Tetratricopeptide repeat protein n=1 Tax=Candidatus Marithioploca araucensis TaxID=70273 RepID=A0ABT7VQG6_9GAMM|nr:tetratricopeptide repeat protein [Candidatus Marithioploca araucensis]